MLAIDGGNPVRLTPWPMWPHYDADEIDMVQEVLRSGKVNYWTGVEGKQFESEYAHYCRRKHAVAVSNGSVALELALRVLDIGADDEVIVPCRSFVATASSVPIAGARPVFSDIDPVSQVMTVDTISQVLTERTKAIIVVHLAGWPCEMPEIMRFAKEKGLYVIEDCAQAHGAFIHDKPVGYFGDIAAFSFCQDKIMTTGGEGGMLVMDDESIWKKAWQYKDHGKSYDDVHSTKHKPGFRWLHKSFGTNWRLTEMQSAIGRLQLGKLPDWNRRRTDNANFLYTETSDIDGISISMPPEYIQHAWYKFYVFVKQEYFENGWDRDRVIAAINAEGIPCITGSCGEIYLERSFQNAGYAPESRFANAKTLADTSIMLQVHPTLTTTELEQTVDAARKVLSVAMRTT